LVRFRIFKQIILDRFIDFIFADGFANAMRQQKTFDQFVIAVINHDIHWRSLGVADAHNFSDQEKPFSVDVER